MGSKLLELPFGELITADAVNPLDKRVPLYQNVRLMPGGYVTKRMGYIPVTAFVPPNDFPTGLFHDWAGGIYHAYRAYMYEGFTDVTSFLSAVDCPRGNADFYDSVGAYKMRYFAAVGERIVKRRTFESYGGSAPTWERVGLPKAPTPAANVTGAGNVEPGARMYKICYYNSVDDIRGEWSDASNQINPTSASRVEINTGVTAAPNDPVTPAFADQVIIARQYANGTGFYEIDKVNISVLASSGGIYVDNLSDINVPMGGLVYDTWRPCKNPVTGVQESCNVLCFAEGRMFYGGFRWSPGLIEISRPMYVEEAIDALVVGDENAWVVGIFEQLGRIIVVKQDGIFEILELSEGAFGSRKLFNVGVNQRRNVLFYNDTIFAWTIDRRFVMISPQEIKEIGEHIEPRADEYNVSILPCPQQNEIWFAFENTTTKVYTVYAWCYRSDTWRKYTPIDPICGYVSEDGILYFLNSLGNIERLQEVARDGLDNTVGYSPKYTVASDVSVSPIIPVSDSIGTGDHYGVPVYLIKSTETSVGFLGFAKITDSVSKQIVLDRNVTLSEGDVITFGTIHAFFMLPIKQSAVVGDRMFVSGLTTMFKERLDTNPFYPPHVKIIGSANVETPEWDYHDYTEGVPVGSGQQTKTYKKAANFLHIVLGRFDDWSNFAIQNVYVDMDERSRGGVVS